MGDKENETGQLSDTFTVDPAAGAESADPTAHTRSAVRPAEDEAPLSRSSGSWASPSSTVLPRLEFEGGGGPLLVTGARTRYEDVKTLGEGGMGEVLLARDNDIQRLVARKRLKNASRSSVLARFVEEIRTVGQLEHASIVPIHDVGRDEDGQYFYVMKYVEGETLESVLDRLASGDADYHKKYDISRRVLVFREILRTIHYAHTRGIIHRDIKPSNIMVGAQGEVMVLDWGLAKQIRRPAGPRPEAPSPQVERIIDAISDASEPEGGSTSNRMAQTAHGQVMGTLAYMSPEQARGDVDQVDERSDIYSLGALWYRMLALRHYLSPKRDARDLVRGILEELPVIPTVAAVIGPQGQPPHHLGKLALKALAKDPRRRYQSVSEMIDFINEHIGGIPVCGYECPVTVMDYALGRLKQGIWHKNLLIAQLIAPVVLCALPIFALFGIFEMVRDRQWWVLIPLGIAYVGWYQIMCMINVGGPAMKAQRHNAKLGFKARPFMSHRKDG
jgi:serine/threonine-protein kinase